ncbi:MAG: tetratricopeptide repeat protein [Desulfomonile tiedjei]|nr:tetratricopeptide repeat protein [Desulfomonile tiedjei]
MNNRIPVLIALVFLVTALVPFSHGSELSADDFFREGYLASMSRDWDEAITLYSKAIQLNPQHAEAYFQRAVTLEIANRMTEAVADYEKTLQLRPDYYLALEYLAKLYDARGEHTKAIDLYLRALPLVSDTKWKSIVRWWISEARRKMSQPGASSHRTRRERTGGSPSE